VNAPRVLVAGLIGLAACTGGGGGGTGDQGEAQQGTEIVAPGVEAVELVAPEEEGAGEVPTFEWEPVDGASSYRLVVIDADGNATWAWEGPETSTTLGGVLAQPPEAGGPVITPGSSWSVPALDRDGHALAVSPLRPVSP
jgi:hypothetical protein